MKHRLAILWVLLATTAGSLTGCGDDNGTTTPTPTTTTTAAATIVTDFTLQARDCFFSWSRPLETLAVGDSFTIRFKPLEISEPRSGDWASAAEFWLDRLGPDDRNAIGMSLIWRPNSLWSISFYSPGTGYSSNGDNETIHLRGKFREVTYVRAAGVSEWLLDGVSVVQIPDTKPQRTIYTRVIGTTTLFEFEEAASTLRAASSATESGDCMGESPCPKP